MSARVCLYDGAVTPEAEALRRCCVRPGLAWPESASVLRSAASSSSVPQAPAAASSSSLPQAPALCSALPQAQLIPDAADNAPARHASPYPLHPTLPAPYPNTRLNFSLTPRCTFASPQTPIIKLAPHIPTFPSKQHHHHPTLYIKQQHLQQQHLQQQPACTPGATKGPGVEDTCVVSVCSRQMVAWDASRQKQTWVADFVMDLQVGGWCGSVVWCGCGWVWWRCVVAATMAVRVCSC